MTQTETITCPANTTCTVTFEPLLPMWLIIGLGIIAFVALTIGLFYKESEKPADKVVRQTREARHRLDVSFIQANQRMDEVIRPDSRWSQW
jgi:hypothetical protein